MSQFMENVQDQLRRSSRGLLTLILRILVGLFLGFVIALAARTLSGFGEVVFWFTIAVVVAAFIRISQKWSAFSVGIFLLLCILVGLLLRMYIVIAPG